MLEENTVEKFTNAYLNPSYKRVIKKNNFKNGKNKMMYENWGGG